MKTVETENAGLKRAYNLTIPAKDIKLRKRQPFSVMPDNVALGLSAQDLADLAEFLLNAPTMPSK